MLGKFQTVAFSHWKGTSDKNHLGGIFQLNPNKATNLMVTMRTYKYGPSFESHLQSIPVKEFDDDSEYFWDIIGSSRRNIPLVEARDENGVTVAIGATSGTTTMTASTLIGAGTAPFYLVFGEDWFADGEYIVGNLNEVYQFRILGEGRAEGGNTVYKVELAGGNVAGVPVERLLSGERFSVDAAYVEDSFSMKVGDVRFTSPSRMRNEWSTVRIQHEVGGNMLNQKLAVGIPVVKDGKHIVQDMWMHYVDWEVENQFSEYKNNALIYGRSNRTSDGQYRNIGKSGRVIKTGDGYFAQAKAGNYVTYNTFSLKKFTEYLTELATGVLDYSERVFVVRTGARGATQFHEEVLKTVSGWQAFQINADQLSMVKKTTAGFTGDTQALAAGFQFTEYLAPNGIRIKLEVDESYDDPVRNKVQYYKGGPAFSYRYDIMYLGTQEQPNIMRCKIKGQEEYRGLKAA